MDEHGLLFGIALIAGTVILFCVPTKALPKTMQDAPDRIARIWGITTEQLKIAERAFLVLIRQG
jgi:hypothetical protein